MSEARGRSDGEVWKAHRGECCVRRFWAYEPDMRGLLVHRPGGRGGASCAFELGEKLDDEEQGFRLADHAFKPGNMSLSERRMGS